MLFFEWIKRSVDHVSRERWTNILSRWLSCSGQRCWLALSWWRNKRKEYLCSWRTRVLQILLSLPQPTVINNFNLLWKLNVVDRSSQGSFIRTAELHGIDCYLALHWFSVNQGAMLLVRCLFFFWGGGGGRGAELFRNFKHFRWSVVLCGFIVRLSNVGKQHACSFWFWVEVKRVILYVWLRWQIFEQRSWHLLDCHISAEIFPFALTSKVTIYSWSFWRAQENVSVFRPW